MTATKEQLAAGREKMAEMRAAGWKPPTPVEKYKANPTSLRARVNANCWLCVGESRQHVTDCTVVSCPFHDVRPWQKQAASDNL